LTRRAGNFDPKRDYYKLLGVPPHANPQAIQQAYRVRAKELHPDLNPERREWATEQFQRLNEAYKILSDPALRREYDERRNLMVGQSQRDRTNRRRQSNSDWWDVPHQRQSGYRGVRQDGPAVDYRPGAWLQKMGLGLFRPVYIALHDLANSPYRWLLVIVVLILLAYVVVFAKELQSDDEPQSVFVPATTTPSDNGQVITVIPPTRLPPSIPITACAPELSLTVESIEVLAQSELLKVSVWVPTPNLRVYAGSVYVMHIEVVSQTEARPLDSGQNAELVVSPNVDSAAQGQPVTTADLPAGSYLLNWTPLAPDGRVLGTCQQVFTVTNG
jgi:hypothetical protein